MTLMQLKQNLGVKCPVIGRLFERMNRQNNGFLIPTQKLHSFQFDFVNSGVRAAFRMLSCSKVFVMCSKRLSKRTAMFCSAVFFVCCCIIKGLDLFQTFGQDRFTVPKSIEIQFVNY